MSTQASPRYLKQWWTSGDGLIRVFEVSSPLARLIGGAMVLRGSVVERVFIGPFAKTRAVRLANQYRAYEWAERG